MTNKRIRKKRVRDPVAEFEALSDAEKERIWESFNREIPRSELLPLTPAQRKQWERVKRKMGRPKVGEGAQVISLSVERRLLRAVDALARQAGISRAAVFARGAKTLLESTPEPPERRVGSDKALRARRRIAG
jgi:hypothetical protein